MATGSVGCRIDEHRGVGVGFDLLRLGLACSVIVYHAFGVVGAATSDSHWQILGESIVPAFFVLSGFLVTASALRSTLPQFVINRACRILPALIVVVALSALVVGPCLTTFGLRTYFTDPRTADYFLNILGDSQMELPGVFAGLAANQTFNVSLWTVGWEMFCYALVAVLLATRALGKVSVGVALFASIMAFRLGLYIAHPDIIHVTRGQLEPFVFPGLHLQNLPFDRSVARWSPNWLTNRLALHVTSWEFRVVLFFLTGLLFWLWRYQLRRSRWLAAGCGVALVIVSLAFPGQESTPVTTLLTAAPIGYLVAYIGTVDLPLPRIVKGDYSYGIYLWSFPIQQIVHYFGADGGRPWANMLLALPVALAAGCLSWHLVEMPVLAKRRFMIGRFETFPALPEEGEGKRT
jgi:peptidoglycan/LPS O-acetylase OafA/YrhL